MSLATRCPHCNTLFKVSLGQLQIHDGQVRCGHCKQVFSGVEHLTAADSDAWESLQQALMSDPSDTPPTPASPPPQGPDFLAPRSASRSARQGKATAVAAGFTQAWRQSTPLWRAAYVGLLALACLQSAWWGRPAWAAHWPGLGAQLRQAPSSMQWAFAQPASQSLQLQGSGLTRTQAQQLQLDITLHNPGPLPARWPVLQVSLTDSQNQILATRQLRAKDYLLRSNAPQAVQQPIQSGQTVELLAYLNTAVLQEQMPNTTPVGFQIQVLDGAFRSTP